MALSTYLPHAERLLSDELAANATDRPVFVAHGSLDPMVPCASGKFISESLKRQRFDVEWHEYPIPHAVSPEEIGDIGRWLARVLPPS